MSIVKLAAWDGEMTPSMIGKHDALSGHGVIKGGVGQYHNWEMIQAGKRVLKTKDEIKHLTKDEINAGIGHVKRQELAKHVDQVQHHSDRLRAITHPGGDSGRMFASTLKNPTAAKLTEAITASNASTVESAEASVGSFLDKAKGIISANPGKSLAVAGGLAAGYLIHRGSKKDNQRQQQYIN